MNYNRPYSMRKTVQLMVILTLLAWATQTLFHQWGYGATIGETANGPPAGGKAANAGEFSRPRAHHPPEGRVPVGGGGYRQFQGTRGPAGRADGVRIRSPFHRSR